MKKAIGIAGVVFIVGFCVYPIVAREQSANVQWAFVERVIDGDTIEVRIENGAGGLPGGLRVVRYIGMDTPETVDPNRPVECFGHEASERNRELVAGQRVELVKDVSEHDAYGRLLRYVYREDGTFVDLELVREGYARTLAIAPDTAFEAALEAAEQSAKSAHRGFWGACSKYPFVD